MSSFSTTQWALGALAAWLIGVSKTGLPGAGMLVVPLMALVFEQREGVGATLLLLLAADVFAVAWYRQHARWDTLRALAPWVGIGIVLGAAALWLIGEDAKGRDQVNRVIGALVLIMLSLSLINQKLGNFLQPRSTLGIALTGSTAGFATTVSNAAGPILTIYLSALRLPKFAFIGTTAWFFLIFNAAKVPVYAALTALDPSRALFTTRGFVFDLVLLPAILLGALAGRWLLPRVSQTLFNGAALSLAALAALRLLVG
ncbi:MAG: sulfite exporter TauE/SafE family protein [Anaerolineae bacterium]|nr:sulfite exporter TauE/SafE family protein [Thermoflexales bacterium]MDW8291813.1 sulfite exporter TauE/SafE family protein [Anaerolineae bacterium]